MVEGSPHVNAPPSSSSSKWSKKSNKINLYVNYTVFVIYFITSSSSSSSVFCPRAGPSLQTLAPRLQFCPKAGLPLQTQEPRLQFYWRWIGVVASRCFPHPALSLTSEQTLKVLKRSQGHQHGGQESWIYLTGISGLHRNSPQGLNISSIRVSDQIEIWKSQSPFFSFIIISVLPKGRSFTANSCTKAAILPKGRSYIPNLGT